MVKNPSAMQETQVQLLGQEDPLEKEMATHSSILAQRILWTEEPGGLQSMGSQTVRHDLVTKPPPPYRYACIYIFIMSFPGGFSGEEPACQCRRCERCKFSPWMRKIPWRRERLPTPAFWPEEFHGLYSLWGHKESDTMEQLSLLEPKTVLA